MRQFYKASEIEPILIGFTVVGISNKNDSDDLSFTYLNNNGVAIQVVFTDHGNFIGDPYASGGNLPVIEIREEKDKGELVDIAIQKTLNQIGVPHNLKGYIYLASAIDKCISERSKLNHVTKVMYKEIADENSDTVSRVERAIRHAVEVSWNRGNASVVNKIFGYTVVAEKGRPTNSEFIALVADFISIRMNEIVDGTYRWNGGGE